MNKLEKFVHDYALTAKEMALEDGLTEEEARREFFKAKVWANQRVKLDPGGEPYFSDLSEKEQIKLNKAVEYFSRS